MIPNTGNGRYDVAIMGGGLAGLCVSLQLKKRLPQLRILVIERRKHPVPEATHKVGESSVEIAAHYFDTVLGLKEHLVSRHLKKFGFRFFFSDGCSNIDEVTEVGASRYLHTPSYQIDRGIFENFLGETAWAQGIHFVDGAVICGFELRSSHAEHDVSYTHAGEQHTAMARWLIDATGRAGMIKRRRHLEKHNNHDVNAAWFRIDSRITIDEWSNDPLWRARCTPRARWLSTNHLVGDGYWAWLIPLSSGSHSVGIVADSRVHPSTNLDSFEKVIVWLDRHQPRLAAELRQKKDLLQDFAFLRHLSYGCKQVFSSERWALTGEAGMFLDPFYSPGSDFIAIANTYITELVASDHEGNSIIRQARIYERLFQSFYDSTLPLYTDQYSMFGNATVFPVKIVWDYTYYWGILCQLFFQRRLTDTKALGALADELELCNALNLVMQKFLRNWARGCTGHNAPVMFDHARLDWFAEMNRGLRDKLDDAGFTQRIRDSSRRLQTLALEIVDMAQATQPSLSAVAIKSLITVDASAITEHQMLADAYHHTATNICSGPTQLPVPP